MSNLTGIRDLRDAIATLDEGRMSAAELERLSADALTQGAVTADEVLRELRRAVNRTASAAIVARLQLEMEDPSKRVVTPLAKRVDDVADPPVTELRFLDHDMAVAANGGGNRSRIAASSRQTRDRNLRWIDPEPLSARTDDSKLIGQVLGNRYRIDRQLDSGVMGVVYLSADLEANDAPVAVTLLRPELRSFSEALGFLRTEVRVTRMLRHASIARVYSLNSDRPGVYLVTEFLEGQTLDAKLRQMSRGLPVSETCSMIADVCAGLAYAHHLDVVHGDLQPANVFISPNGESKILNFGLARAAGTRNGRFDARKLSGQSFAYISPDMLTGRLPDPRDDVYSLGCVIYSALCGVHPFGSRTAVEARDLGLSMTPLPNLSKEQNAALAQALVFECESRTPSVIELLARLGWAKVRPTADPKSVPALATAVPTQGAAPVAMSMTAPAVLGVSPTTTSAETLVAEQAASVSEPSEDAPASETAVSSVLPIEAPPAEAESKGAAPDTAPSVARRVRRSGRGRLPIPPIKSSPRSPQPLSASSLPPPPRRAWGSYLMPVVTGLVLLSVIACLGIYLYSQRATDGGAGRSHTNVEPLPPTPSPSAAVGADNAGNAPPPPPASAVVNPPASPSSLADRTSGTGATLPLLRPVPKAAVAMASSDNCPYPREAMDQGVTGTVFLAVYVASDGKPTKIKVDRSSGSDVLDQAANRCVERFARFPASSTTPSSGYWGRYRFKWSFGS